MSVGGTLREVASSSRGSLRRAAGPLRAFPPTFLIIGAQRAGTTSLFKFLSERPDVVGATRREVHYFDVNHRRGMSWYRAQFPLVHQRWFASRGLEGPAPVGESSPYALFHPLSPGRVARTLPDVRIIVLLRDPVARAYSHYLWQSQHFLMDDLSFEEAIDREPERLRCAEDRMRAEPAYRSVAHQSYSYLSRGLYADQLERWFDVIPRERFLVLKAESVFSDPATELPRVCGFLGIPPAGLERYERQNAVESNSPMSATTEKRLRAHFEGPNRRLEELLGPEFTWSSPSIAVRPAGRSVAAG